MLDMNMFRENKNIILADHDKRNIPYDNINEVIRLDKEWRKARYESDVLRKERNEAARGIAAAKKNNDAEEVERIMKEVATIGSKIEKLGILADEFLEKRDANWRENDE